MPTKKGTKNSNMARMGKSNGRFKGGKSSDYRRRITNAKPGELVHHKNKNKGDNKKSNFEVLKPGLAKTSKGVKKVTAVGKHNILHPEKSKGLRKKRK